MVVSFFAFLKCLAGMLPQHTPHFICAFLLSCFPSPWTGKAVGHRSRVLLALAECLAHLMSHGGGCMAEGARVNTSPLQLGFHLPSSQHFPGFLKEKLDILEWGRCICC